MDRVAAFWTTYFCIIATAAFCSGIALRVAAHRRAFVIEDTIVKSESVSNDSSHYCKVVPYSVDLRLSSQLDDPNLAYEFLVLEAPARSAIWRPFRKFDRLTIDY